MTAKAKYSSKETDDGLVQILDGTKVLYQFREPRGKDLVTFEKQHRNKDVTDIETMSFIMAALSSDSYSPEYFLDLPLTLYKHISQELNQFFLAPNN